MALAKIDKSSKWQDADNDIYTIRGIMDFMRDKYSLDYKANTRETVRKDVMHYFLQFGIIESNRDKPDRPTNSPKFCYSLTVEFVELIRVYKTNEWEKKLKNYKDNTKRLIDKYSKEREINRIPVKINENEFTFSPGKHNQLQKAIIDDFASIFAPGASVLYIGDTDNKNLIREDKILSYLGIDMHEYAKLPDVILYIEDRNWIYFIEAVTSVGPINEKRIVEIGEMTKECKCGKIYVTAFLDRETFRKFAHEIAFETEVWIADRPEHMIHYNGDRFLGPRE